jgi:hypothetical protein
MSEASWDIDNTSTAHLPPLCAYCGQHHTTVCPRIVEIEYHSNGMVKRVVLREWEPSGQIR